MWLLLVTKEQSEGDYCSKTSKWDLYWLFFIGLVCGIEFAYQKGCFVRHFVVWADISQPESFWHRCWDGWLLVCHEGSSPLTCPLQSLLLWKQYLSQYSLLWNLPFVSWWQLDGWMEKLIFDSKPPLCAPSGQKWGWSGDRSSAKTASFSPRIWGRFWDVREVSLPTY